ncbi:uncharacterized protein LOC117134682 [Drosophila busckii]|uniref:uncharacterized protein LOC117134682 n=1 Tax=Drosophila busckii TaxID=30019 RepID=UPI001433082E|nr:uncharacterized protein LOC117134682 [Drosophila busckii]
MFTSIIDKDCGLSDVEKFQHLRSCLKGPALDTVSSLEISSANYTIALDLLKRRFNNKRLIFQSHVTDILSLNRIESSSAVKLRSLSDTVNANIRTLQSLGSAEQIAGCIIVHSLLQKVDKATQANWEETTPMDTIPTCEQFIEFLDRRCQRLENVEHAMATYTPSTKSTPQI